MKTTLLTALSCFLVTALFAQNYYWVGDGGNWSDLTHWATTSGGSVLHETLPSALNEVVFDERSFTKSGQKVLIDLEEVHCNVFMAAHLKADASIDFSNSTLHTNSLDLSNVIELDASKATLYVGVVENTSGIFNGGGHHFHHVIFEHNIRISGNNTFDLFELMPGANIRLANESWQGAGQFILFGTVNNEISITTENEVGETAFFEQVSGWVNASYLKLQNVNALGNAKFIATESEDLGNNRSWKFDTREKQDEKNVETPQLQGNLFLKPYPNPSSSNFAFQTQEGEQYDLFDQSGRLVRSIYANGSRAIVDISDLAVGVYYLKSLTGETVTEKVVVSR